MTIQVERLHVTATGESSATLLHDIHCTIEKGEITLVIGRTGSGKTTLLDALSGLTKPQSGSVIYGQETLWRGRRLNPLVLHKTGSVFQYPEHHLFARTVQGEFDYSLKPLRLPRAEADARAKSAMQSLHLPPELLAESPLVLSGGQKRRVALGSTLATQPEWLFLDEPTSGLDPETTQALLAFLLDWKKNTNGGAVVATHDLDAFLPICDRVLVMRDGRLHAALTPIELCQNPNLLMQSGVGLPSAVDAAVRLRDRGYHVPVGCITADALADAILASQKSVPALIEPALHRDEATLASASSPSPSQRRGHRAESLDPRTKWLFAILFSIGILVTPTWAGLAYAALLVGALVAILQVPLRELSKWLKPVLAFIVISVGLSGLVLKWQSAHFAGLGFSFAPAIGTLKQWSRLFLVMVLGLLLPLTTSHQQIKKGIERALSPLPGMKNAAEAFALAAALLLRFIPVLTREIERFSKVARARGKSRAVPGNLRAGDLRVVMVPLLLSVFQLADHLTLAMEARGYRKIGQSRTSSLTLAWSRRDALAAIIAMLLALPLLFIR